MFMSGLTTTQGKNVMLDRSFNLGIYNPITYYQFGMCAKAPLITDTKLYAPVPIITSGNATIDACDAITGWSASGDGTSVVLDTTAGNRLEGTGSLDLLATHSTGTATYYKTVSIFSGATKYLFFGFYINSLAQLTSATDTIKIELGTSGYTNTNVYNFNYTQLQAGWNGIVCNVDSPDSIGGSGAVEATIDRIRVNIKIASSLTTDDIIMDWIHTYPIANTWGSYDVSYPIHSEANRTVSTRTSMNSTQGNGYILREIGKFTSDTVKKLVDRDNFSSVSKDQYITLTFDESDKLS